MEPKESRERTEKILIGSDGFLTRAAIVRNGKLEFLFVERDSGETLVGNIYKGKVANVLKGLNAAFVNIGESRNGFLPFESTEDFYPEADMQERAAGSAPARCTYRVGEEVIVQITKPATELKGVKLTRDVSIPGRLVVLLPYTAKRGISRRIESPEERKRLFQILEKAVPGTMGFIMRTACAGKKEEQIANEARHLLNLWSRIRREAQRRPAPALLWKERGVASIILRDYVGEHLDEVLVDDPRMMRELQGYARGFVPEACRKLKLYQETTPLFVKMGIEPQIEAFLETRVPLPSGGYILIEEGEALTAIDVNTGGSQRRSQSETIFHTNAEAAREIPRQIRIRNLSGLIVIDFIDMRGEQQRRKIYRTLDEAMEEDKARIKILSISRLGLAEMSREKIGLSLSSILKDKCPCCDGTGSVVGMELAAIQMKNQVRRKLAEKAGSRVLVKLAPEFYDFVKQHHVLRLRLLERRRVRFEVSAGLGRTTFSVSGA